MKHNPGRTLLATPLLVAVLAVAGCSEDSSGEGDPPPPTESNGNGQTETAAAETEGDSGPAATGEAPAEGGEGPAYPDGSAPLESSQSHESGVTVDLTRIEVEGNTLSIDLTALNATTWDVALAWGVNDGIEVRAGDSPPLLFRPPADNDNLEVPSGGELTGTLAFVGRIPPDATSVSVLFNPAGSDSPDGPVIAFDDVPLP